MRSSGEAARSSGRSLVPGPATAAQARRASPTAARSRSARTGTARARQRRSGSRPTCTASSRARCRRLARRGAEGAGRRRALVRARRPRGRQDLRPLRGRAQPGLRRPRSRSRDERGRGRQRARRPLRGQGRDDLLLLLLRRPHRRGGRRLRQAGARTSSRWRTRTTRPRRTTSGGRWRSGADGGKGARGTGRADLDVAAAVSGRVDSPSCARRRGGDEDRTGTDVRAALGLRSTWFTTRRR